MLQNKIITIKFLSRTTLLLFSTLTYNSDDNNINNTTKISSKECCICFFCGFFPCCSIPALYGTIKETEASVDAKILVLQERLKEKSSQFDQLEKEINSLKEIINTNQSFIPPVKKIQRENNLLSFYKEEKQDL
ncbi:MAG: hypothetical protein ACXWL5_01055 [Candidatus Chromulinivorax sp.]